VLPPPLHMVLAEAGVPFDQIAEWAKWGGGWALVPVLAAVIYFLDKRAHKAAVAHAEAIDKCQLERIGDWKDVSRSLEGHTIAMNSLTIALNNVADASEKRTEATNRLAEASKVNTSALERLIQIADAAASSNRELREKNVLLLSKVEGFIPPAKRD
jgi:hypothetical protein